MEKRIITIGRECGSGGHTIGKLVAEKLGIAFYDKEIVEMVAAKTKLAPEFIAAHGEYFHSGSLGHIIGYGGRFAGASLRSQSSLQDQMFFVQSDLIQEIAEREPCVIVGRCADYILQDRKDKLDVFIHSAMPFKVERSVREHGLDPEKAESILKKRDRARKHHYNFYTHSDWGRAEHYSITLDSGVLGVPKCVELICCAAR